MTNPAARLRHLLDTARRRWQTDHGGVAAKELVGIAAVAVVILAAAITVLEVVGIDVGGWLGEQFGTTSSG